MNPCHVPDASRCAACGFDAAASAEARAELDAARAHPAEAAELEEATALLMNTPRRSWLRGRREERLARARSEWERVTDTRRSA